MKLKWKTAALLERAFKVRVISCGPIARLFEEEHLRRFFREFKIDCVFDVGANAGQYAMMIRNCVGYKGPIISFEPNPSVAAQLREKAERDGCWFVADVALSSAPGRAAFNVTAEDQMASLHRPQSTETKLFDKPASILRTIDVEVSTLEIELTKYQKTLGFKRPFLKMDTQGHDINVAVGAGTMLSKFTGLQSELAIKRIYADTLGYQDALNYYSDHGFILSALVPNNEGFFPYLIEMDCIMFHKDARTDLSS